MADVARRYEPTPPVPYYDGETFYVTRAGLASALAQHRCPHVLLCTREFEQNGVTKFAVYESECGVPYEVTRITLREVP